MIGTFPATFKEAALKYADEALCFVPKIGVELKLALDVTCNNVKLNTEPNKSGFITRSEQGKIAGQRLLEQLQSNVDPTGAYTCDTLDIVCHSMGYAYALGMIDYIKNKVPLGRLYIIAPENAESGGTDWNLFTEVWQYGSDEVQLKDKTWLQDGVAPQVPALGIEQLPTEKTKGGRAYIPINVDGIPQGFISSHSIGNYKWIFENEGRAGYVKQRK